MVHNFFSQKMTFVACALFTLSTSVLLSFDGVVLRQKEPAGTPTHDDVMFGVSCLQSLSWRQEAIKLEVMVTNSDDIEKYATDVFFRALLLRFLSDESDAVCLSMLYSVLDNVKHSVQRKMFDLFQSSHVAKLISLLESDEILLQVHSATILNHVAKRFRSENSLARFFSLESIIRLIQRCDWFVENMPTDEQTSELCEALENLEKKLPKKYTAALSIKSCSWLMIPELSDDDDPVAFGTYREFCRSRTNR